MSLNLTFVSRKVTFNLKLFNVVAHVVNNTDFDLQPVHFGFKQRLCEEHLHIGPVIH